MLGRSPILALFWPSAASEYLGVPRRFGLRTLDLSHALGAHNFQDEKLAQ